MTNCEVYELLSFLLNENDKEEIVVTVQSLNKLEQLLRRYNIRCNFEKHFFEKAAIEYPDKFKVTDSSIVVSKNVTNPSCKSFVYYNSNPTVYNNIQKSWKEIKNVY